MIEAIFFDVDGTIFSHTYNRIPQSTIYALDLLKEKGIRRVLATGRSMVELHEIHFSYLDFDAYILLNGQLILDHDFHVISGTPLPENDFQKLIDLYNQKEIPIQLIEAARYYINRVNEQVIQAQSDIHTPVPDIQEYSGEPIYQAVAFVGSKQADELETLLSNCRITRWNDTAIDIISKVGGKAYGIRQYLELMHISKDNTMSFGDDENDLDMLAYTHIGIAMGNAKEKVKQSSDYITASIDEAGIFQALKHFHII